MNSDKQIFRFHLPCTMTQLHLNITEHWLNRVTQ